MSAPVLEPDIVATINGTDYSPRLDSTIKLDAGAVPYANSTVSLPVLDDATQLWLDPRNNRRIILTCADGSGTPRVFNLGLRKSTVDHVAKTTTLELDGDESLLGDYAPLVDDATPRTYQASARAVCNYVLGKVLPGTALEATPSTDADVTSYWAVTNMVIDPNCTVVANSATGTNASGLVTSALFGLACMRWTSTAAGASNIYPSMWDGSALKRVRVDPGKSYVVSFQLASSVARSAQIVVQWRLEDGTTVIQNVNGVASNTSTTAWKKYSLVAVAPAGAGFGIISAATTGNAAGNLHYVREVMFYEDTEVVPGFDGNTAAGGGYTYSWSGTANASPSTRTPVIDRPRESLIWMGDQYAWDFLVALLATVGLVLWCDEARKWRLQTPESRALTSIIAVTAARTREGQVALDRGDPETWSTGVAVRYEWTDDDGIQRSKLDTAGTPEKVYAIRYDRPYPGPGAAAAMLARRSGSGRAQDLTVTGDWSTTPGATAQVALPSAPDTFGRVAAVTFYADGFMQLGLAGILDIIPGSIDALVGTINAQTGNINSL